MNVKFGYDRFTVISTRNNGSVQSREQYKKTEHLYLQKKCLKMMYFLGSCKVRWTNVNLFDWMLPTARLQGLRFIFNEKQKVSSRKPDMVILADVDMCALCRLFHDGGTHHMVYRWCTKKLHWTYIVTHIFFLHQLIFVFHRLYPETH